MVEKVPQLVDNCFECGKKILRKPTLLDTIDNVILLCYDCYIKFKKREMK